MACIEINGMRMPENRVVAAAHGRGLTCASGLIACLGCVPGCATHRSGRAAHKKSKPAQLNGLPLITADFSTMLYAGSGTLPSELVVTLSWRTSPKPSAK